MSECLGNLDVRYARGIGFSAINTKSWPYGTIVSQAFRPGSSSYEDFLTSFIPAWTHYQEWFRKQSVATFYGLTEASVLNRIPAWAHVLPWGERSPKEMMSWLPPRIRRNRNLHGAKVPRFKTRNQIMKIDSLFSAESHGKQFFELSSSMFSDGAWAVCNRDDPFKVWLLERAGETRWIVYSGNHRIAAIAANNISTVHAELQGRVIEQEVNDWPNVKNSSFTEAEALSIFDNLWDGNLQKNTAEMLATLPRGSR